MRGQKRVMDLVMCAAGAEVPMGRTCGQAGPEGPGGDVNSMETTTKSKRLRKTSKMGARRNNSNNRKGLI